MIKNLIFSCLLFSISLTFSQREVTLDSIYKLRELAKNSSFSYADRLQYAKSATQLSNDVKIDSTILKSKMVLSGNYLNMDDYENYKRINLEILEKSSKLEDSIPWAYSLHQLGWYYDYNIKYDSAYYYYYNAQKIYSALNNIYNESSVLLNMAIIQKDERDYIGAEKNAIKALELAKSLPKNDNVLDTLWSLHNLLANISSILKDYNDALTYYNMTEDIANDMSSPYYYLLHSKNNIANTYNRLGEYEIALPIFKEIIEDPNLLRIDADLFVIALSNYAHTKSLLDHDDKNVIVNTFKRAYHISDSLENPVGKIGSLTYLSDHYLKNNKNDSALITLNETYTLSKRIRANEFILKSLKQLSEIESEDKSKLYLKEYIKLSDSLLDNERAIRNKFARIEYETDQIKAEKEKVTKERLIFLLSSIALFATLIFLYIIITQRARNKKLEFTRMQQEANEEIYNLMLAQQDKIDEGRTQEKKRISEELHDGILGRLFGTRLSLDSLNLQNTDDAVKTRGQYIDELKSIEQEIRKISHDLNTDFVSGRSFSTIIRSLIETQTQAYQLSYDYNEDDDIDWDGISNRTKIHIYRMLQETMQNIYKHAKANHIIISFQLKNDVILLAVQDNGSGFNTNKARKGIGLKNFDSRASEIGGKVEIFSKLGQGTKVVIHIPIA